MKKLLIPFIAATSALSAQIDFSQDFSTVADGALNTIPFFEGQPNWSIESGSMVGGAGWGRARNLADGRVEIGDSVNLTLNDFTVVDDVASTWAFGIANFPEHTGATMPQVFAQMVYTAGGGLSFGGSNDTGFNFGDVADITLSLTRVAADNWTMASSIVNNTDATSFSSVASPVDGNISGSTSASTVGAYLDADSANTVRYGWRGQGAGTDVSVGSLAVSTVVPEPSSYALLAGLAALGFIAVRRRK